MQANHPDIDLDGEVPVSGEWLKSLWYAAQKCMLGDAIRSMQELAPVPLVVVGHEDENYTG
jgi:hypothetical protein